MKKKADRKKLALPKETVRTLRALDLQNVAGGFSDEGSCIPWCDIDER